MLGLVGEVEGGFQMRCGRRSLLEVDVNSCPQCRQPATSDEEWRRCCRRFACTRDGRTQVVTAGWR
jgi:hypothetical protein